MKFFISTPLDFESLTAEELQKVWSHLLEKDGRPTSEPLPKLQVVEGGVELETSLFLGVQLNFFLKTANRILLRLAEFKARDLPKFYQKVAVIPWAEYLKSSDIEWNVSAQGSRLNNEKRLTESADKALREKLPFREGIARQKIFVRMVDDFCTISLDTSGEHLHKRGWMNLRGEAPLRETWAAILLQELIRGEDTSEATLVDPMVGSGSFLLEARSWGFPNFERKYAFLEWANCPKLFLSPSFVFNYKTLAVKPLFKALQGFDLNPQMESVVLGNYEALQGQMRRFYRAAHVEVPLSFKLANSLELEGPPQMGGGYLIVNPPYGERLSGVEGGMEKAVPVLVRNFAPRKLGILLPSSSKIKAPKGYQVVKSIRVNNGGIRCLFTIMTAL